jgi:MFS family permease
MRTSILTRYLRTFPLGDRVTYWRDLQGAFFFALFNGMTLYFVSFIGRKIGMDVHQLAVMGMSTFLGLFLNVWIGHLSERGDKAKWVFWAGAVSRTLVALALVWVHPWVFLVVMCVSNVVGTFGGPAYTSIMRTNYSNQNRGRIMGIIRIFVQVLSALAAAFAGWLMELYPAGYQVLFPVAGALGVASNLVFYQVKPRRMAPSGETPAEAQGFRSSLQAIAADRLFMAYMAIYFVAGFPDKLLVPLEPIRFVDELGMNYAQAGLVQGTVPLLGAMLGYFLFVKLSHRVSPFVLLVATVLLASARFINTALATDAYQLIPGSFLNGVGNAGWDLLPLFTLMLFVGHEKIGLYFGFFSTLVGLRGLIGPLLGSWMYSAGLPITSVYWIAFYMEVAAAIGLAVFTVHFHRHRKAAAVR